MDRAPNHLIWVNVFLLKCHLFMAECMSRGGVFSSLKSIQYSNRHPMKWIYGLWHIRVLMIVDWKIHPSSWTHCSCRSMNKCFSVPQLFRKVCVCACWTNASSISWGRSLFFWYASPEPLSLYLPLCWCVPNACCVISLPQATCMDQSHCEFILHDYSDPQAPWTITLFCHDFYY